MKMSPRYRIGHLCAAFVAAFCASVFAEAPSTSPQTVAALSGSLPNRPEALFQYVRDEVGTEIYAGSLRGPQGTLWSAAGNSLDKSSLLKSLLERAGHLCRYAGGRLPLEKTEVLVQEMLDNPLDDKRLIGEASDHYWVQFWDSGRWVDLDPSFPDSVVGTKHCQVAKTFQAIPRQLRHCVRVSAWLGLKDDEDNRSRQTCAVRLVAFSDSAAGTPVTLKNVVRKTEDGKLLGFRPCILFGGQCAVGRDIGLAADSEEGQLSARQITSQKLVLQYIPPKGPIETYEAPLRLDFSGGNETTVLLNSGRMPAEAVESAAQGLSNPDDQQEHAEISRAGVLAMTWAARSSKASRDIADSLGIRAYPDRPAAMLIEASPEHQMGSVRSCWNTRRTVAPDDTDPNTFRTYQAMCSVSDAATRTMLIEKATGKRPVSPLAVLKQARDQGVSFKAFDGPADRKALADLEVSPGTRSQMFKALDEGNVLIAPQKPITANGTSPEAWLAIEPGTGVIKPHLGSQADCAVALGVPFGQPDPKKEILDTVARGLTAIAIIYHTEVAIEHAFDDMDTVTDILLADTWKDLFQAVATKQALRALIDGIVLAHVLDTVNKFFLEGTIEGDWWDLLAEIAAIVAVGKLRGFLK